MAGVVNRSLPAALTMSVLGLLGVVGWEGYSDSAYLDSVNVPTLGFGTTQVDGRPVRMGDRTDPVRALQLAHQDLTRKEAEVRRCVARVPLAQYEWDAYLSLAYNIGTPRFCSSTLVRKLNETPPDYAGACREILRWNRAGGEVIRGLVNRREQEYRRCMGL